MCNAVFADDMAQYLSYVDKLKYTDRPDYERVRSIFQHALRQQGLPDDGRLGLTTSPAVQIITSTVRHVFPRQEIRSFVRNVEIRRTNSNR